MDSPTTCPVCGGCEAEDALLSIMQFADQAPDPTADPYGAEAAFGRIVEMARAASQERPQPMTLPERDHRRWMHDPEYAAAYNAARASQERPSIDVERARRAFEIHDMEHHGIGGLHPESCDEWIAAEYLRLSGPVGE